MPSLVTLMALALAPGPPDVGEKVVAFARSKIGQSVGDGDCAALAAEALRHAGARRQGRAWGEEVPSLKDARPGDILQLENTVFVRTRARPGGAVETLTYTSARHVAIVSGVRRRGRRVVLAVLQQNVGFEGGPEADAKVVREGTIDTGELRRGTLKLFRPVAGPGDDTP
jgi:hypothetical protein